VQFMPSNYFQFARRFSEWHDSHGTTSSSTSKQPDIWNSPQDALASIANFLRAHGYQKGDGYGTLAMIRDKEGGMEVCLQTSWARLVGITAAVWKQLKGSWTGW
jgi:membrane-bound lytic murein transglycosylase B